MCARNTLVQLLAAYTNPESHSAQHYRQMDRQTNGQQAAANIRSVWSAKNLCCECRLNTAENLIIMLV